jgi:hypothetical protein
LEEERSPHGIHPPATFPCPAWIVVVSFRAVGFEVEAPESRVAKKEPGALRDGIGGGISAKSDDPVMTL